MRRSSACCSADVRGRCFARIKRLSDGTVRRSGQTTRGSIIGSELRDRSPQSFRRLELPAFSHSLDSKRAFESTSTESEPRPDTSHEIKSRSRTSRQLLADSPGSGRIPSHFPIALSLRDAGTVPLIAPGRADVQERTRRRMMIRGSWARSSRASTLGPTFLDETACARKDEPRTHVAAASSRTTERPSAADVPV
jgi:hypothetical protein